MFVVIQMMLNLQTAINMKNILKITMLCLTVNFATCQINIVPIGGGNFYKDVPSGTYIKDVNNTFNKFLGTWKWQSGNEILVFKIEKVTQYLNQEYGVYEDFIKGNYSYSIDGGITFIVNTISQNVGNNDPDINPMYSCGTLDLNKIKFTFYDVIKNKERCSAYFTFLSSSLTQAQIKIENVGRGYLLPEVPPDPTFSIPDNVIVTKQ